MFVFQNEWYIFKKKFNCDINNINYNKNKKIYNTNNNIFNINNINYNTTNNIFNINNIKIKKFILQIIIFFILIITINLPKFKWVRLQHKAQELWAPLKLGTQKPWVWLQSEPIIFGWGRKTYEHWMLRQTH